MQSSLVSWDDETPTNFFTERKRTNVINMMSQSLDHALLIVPRQVAHEPFDRNDYYTIWRACVLFCLHQFVLR